MIVAVVGLVALSTSLVAFAFWQAKRASDSADYRIKGVVKIGQLERQLDARGRAVDDRDHLIAGLQADLKRHKAAIAVLQKAPPVPEDASDAANAIRDSLSALRKLSMPEAEGTSPGSSPEDRGSDEAVHGTDSSD